MLEYRLLDRFGAGAEAAGGAAAHGLPPDSELLAALPIPLLALPKPELVTLVLL